MTHSAFSNLGHQAALLAAERGLVDNNTGALAGTNAAGLGAFTELVPGTEFTVDRAGSSVAGLVLNKGGALDATVERKGGDRTGALLGALATGKGARSVERPLGYSAVDGASSGVASLGFLEGRACVAAVSSGLSHNAGVNHAATTTALVAFGPEAPFASEAVHRAGLGVAVFGFTKVGAAPASFGNFGDDLAETSGDTSAASLGAGSVLCPGSNDAVNGAGLGIAQLPLDHGAAGLAVVQGFGGNDANTRLDARAAGLGAGGVLAPGSQDAVNWTGDFGARNSLGKSSAGLAIVSGGHSYTAGTGLCATGARLGASRVLAPSRNLAVDGAADKLALDSLLEGRAAAVVVVHDDRASAALVANTASGGASGVGGPLRNAAILSAFASEALVGLGERTTCVATVSSSLEDLARAGHNTSATLNRAGGEGGPGANTAVNGARFDFAFASGGKSTTGTARVFGGAGDGTGGGLGALAAGSGAGRPNRPGAGLAVFGAKSNFACLLFGVRAADLATVHGGGSDGAGAGANTNTTGDGAGRPCSEAALLAVKRAVLSVALLGLLEGGAGLTAVHPGVASDGALAGGDARVAGLGAGRPLSELCDLAVNGAFVEVALAAFSEGTTGEAIVGSGGDNIALAGLDAATARHGASGPGLPFVKYTVHSAGLGVASLCLLEGSTGLAAVGSLDAYAASARVLATTALLCASAPGGPHADSAINGAHLCEAFLLLDELGANEATVKGMSGDGTGALLGALATSLAAGREGSPLGNETVDSTRAFVAVALLGENLALAGLATEGSKGLYAAGTDLETKTTLLRASAPDGPGRDAAINGARNGVALSRLG